MSKCIVFVSDDSYIDHVKSMVINCIEQGKWNDSFAVICPTNSKAAHEFNNYGFDVLEVESKGFLQKFSIFDKYFKKYDEVLYLDCDVIVQDDLQRLFDLLKLNSTAIWADTEDGDTMRTLPVHNRNEEGNKELYEYVKETYPHVYDQTFNSAFLLFKPEYIPDSTPEKLMEIQDKIEPLNRQADGGTDQQVVNLLLWHQMKKIPGKLVCFWGLAEPENDVYSESRGYIGGEIPVALHYSRWYAAWIKKPMDTGAYYNHHLKISCYDLYHKNLNLFNERYRKTI